MEHGNTLDSTGASGYGTANGSGTVLRTIIADLDAGPADSGERYTPWSLTVAARRICAIAHREGLYIEQALIRVKDAWWSTPGRQKPRPGGSDAVLDQLVSACIREFYTDR